MVDQLTPCIEGPVEQTQAARFSLCTPHPSAYGRHLRPGLFWPRSRSVYASPIERAWPSCILLACPFTRGIIPFLHRACLRRSPLQQRANRLNHARSAFRGVRIARKLAGGPLPQLPLEQEAVLVSEAQSSSASSSRLSSPTISNVDIIGPGQPSSASVIHSSGMRASGGSLPSCLSCATSRLANSVCNMLRLGLVNCVDIVVVSSDGSLLVYEVLHGLPLPLSQARLVREQVARSANVTASSRGRSGS